MTRPPILYVSSHLDRSGARRHDDAWFRAQLANATARFVPFWQGRSLVQEAESGLGIVTLEGALLRDGLADLEQAILLGLDGEIPYIAIELAGDDPTESLGLDPAATAAFTDLRAVAARLNHLDSSLLAHAKGLLYFHARHRFCGVCGSPTVSAESGHVRRCTNPDCKTSHFPRTDPAVIMLVADGDNVLLGRQPVWPPGMYSVLAGFVEPGETLEAAVAREVREEAGIEIEDILYQASQPWPFPGSIMLGFRAKAVTNTINFDESELQDAKWVSRQWLKANADSQELRVPPGGAIARRLLEDWLAEG